MLTLQSCMLLLLQFDIFFMTSAVLPSCVSLGTGGARGDETRGGTLSELKFERLCVTPPCAGSVSVSCAECSCCSCLDTGSALAPGTPSPMPSPFSSPLTPARVTPAGGASAPSSAALSPGAGTRAGAAQGPSPNGGLQLSLRPTLSGATNGNKTPANADWLSPNGGDSGSYSSPTTPAGSSGVFSNGSFGLVSPAASCALEPSVSCGPSHSASSLPSPQPLPPASVPRTCASPCSSLGLGGGAVNGGCLVSSPSPSPCPSAQCQWAATTPASPSVPSAVAAIARQARARLQDGQERHSSSDLYSGTRAPDLHLYRIPLTCLTGAAVCQLERPRPSDSGSVQHIRHRSTKL